MSKVETIKSALKFLVQKQIEQGSHGFSDADDNEIYWDEVIGWLEQQPCEDCVSRQTLIDKATSWGTHFTDSERAVSLTDIMSLPSVQPQPKRGKWISVDDGGMCVDGYCSECNNFIPKNVRKILRDYCDGDFCPNCGADMREVQDECKTESKETEERA